MINLDGDQISILKGYIGKRIDYISSSRFDLFKSEITCYDRILKLAFKNSIKHSLTIKSGFFENENGELFHDYIFEEASIDPDNECSKYYIESTSIEKIEVLGRQFPLSDFKSYKEIYEKYNDVRIIDNVLMFHLADGEQLAVIFHDYFPTINVYIGEKVITQFFENTLSVYSLHHTIK